MLLLSIFKWVVNFFYDDTSNNFVWNAQNSLVVFGSVFVTTKNFTNYGDISADT